MIVRLLRLRLCKWSDSDRSRRKYEIESIFAACIHEPDRSDRHPASGNRTGAAPASNNQQGALHRERPGHARGAYSYGNGINRAGVVSGGAATVSQKDYVSQTAFL